MTWLHKHYITASFVLDIIHKYLIAYSLAKLPKEWRAVSISIKESNGNGHEEKYFSSVTYQ